MSDHWNKKLKLRKKLWYSIFISTYCYIFLDLKMYIFSRLALIQFPWFQVFDMFDVTDKSSNCLSANNIDVPKTTYGKYEHVWRKCYTNVHHIVVDVYILDHLNHCKHWWGLFPFKPYVLVGILYNLFDVELVWNSPVLW